MSKFEYPKLSRSEIATILRESNVANIAEIDLKNPTESFVSDLYTRLLIHIGILHEEDQGLVEFADLEQLENPDHHLESVRVMNLCRRIREVVASVDCPVNFTLKDLIRPTADRTDIFLSAIINFSLYKDTKMNEWGPIAEELNLLVEQRKEWELKISQLNADIACYSEARERELPFVQQIEDKIKELNQTIAGLNSHQMSLRASLRKMKEKTVEKSEKISKAEFELVQSVQENANLHSKIVQSPEKLQRALEEKKSARVDAKNSERSAMQSFQERTAILEVYTKAFNKMSRHFSQMQAISEQVNSAKSIEKDYKAVNAKLHDDGLLEKSLEAKLVERQAKVEQLDEVRSQLEKERNLKVNEANAELNNVKSEVESTRQDLEGRRMKVQATMAEVNAITLKSNVLKESGEAKQQLLIHKCEEISEQFLLYTRDLDELELVHVY